MQFPTRGVRRLAMLGTATLTVLVTATALASPAQAKPAEGTIRNAGGPMAVDGSYIVVFKGKMTSRASVANRATELAGRVGGKVGFTYTHALRGFEVRVGEAMARRLAADPSVAYVEQNQRVPLADTQTPVPSWGLDRIDQRNLPLNNSYTYPTVASGVRAYIIDTGIRFTHTNFGGRAVSGLDVIDGGTADDCHGHGSHTAGTTGGSTFGVAKGVTLVAVRVFDCVGGGGTTANITAGVDFVTGDHDPGELAVANMSLGGPANPTIDAAVANSINDGVTYSISAGNSNLDACTQSPARVPAAITVGATDISDVRATFSNFGTCVDVFAPGVSITSAWFSSDTATNTISGTSMSAPHVTGAAALILAQNPSFTPAQVHASVVNNATTGVVVNPGAGSPNRLLFVVNGGPPPPNDFSIAVSPTSGATSRGGSVSALVTTATTSGSPQTVNLSASGLPAGASASFNPASVISGASSTMTITTSASTPIGTFAVSVIGTGTVTHSTPYSLTVTGGTCPSPGQKLVNPGLESGHVTWQATPNVIGQWGSQGQPPHGGTWNAWLVGYGVSNYDILQQTVTLPANCTSYTLTFWLHIDTDEFDPFPFDQMGVQVIRGSTTQTLVVWSNLDAAPGYVQRTVSLNAFAGQTILLRFLAIEDASLQTSFVIDDTALTVA